ncbi:MAG: hypothetical protein R3A44_14230 [Caldilineaceae bacterium]
MMTKLVYLDVCALNRPFDDQKQVRIRLETDAVNLIVSHIRTATLRLVTSPMLEIEISANPNENVKAYNRSLLQQWGYMPNYALSAIRTRAEFLSELNMGAADAAHVAFAEFAEADFVTVDDRLLKLCRRLNIRVWYGTPLAFCDKEDLR